ncbi:hypothetical protein R3I94_001211 [Phoxinus phoxinus]
MRSAVLLVLLVLLVTLMFTDADPCTDRGGNNDYYRFKNRHIISSVFDKNDRNAWARYLTEKGLCGSDRPSRQSFLSRSNEKYITQICNGRGSKYSGNLCISNNRFSVYIVTKNNNPWSCEVQTIERNSYYVVVACNVVDNQCLPVHYQTQTDTPGHGAICRPPTNRQHHWYSRLEK